MIMLYFWAAGTRHNIWIGLYCNCPSIHNVFIFQFKAMGNNNEFQGIKAA